MTIENLIRAFARARGYEIVGDFMCVKIKDKNNKEVNANE